ncbi:hypothetical protein [Loktanella sp. R86503]|uniref:hypothetical protein n=1 Tax=Loktanella sp. R86503 TaxID=3093847 RepID=UPI0036DD993E
MSDLILTKTRLIGGVWHGVLKGATSEPKLILTHKGEAVAGLSLTARDDGTWDVEAAVPVQRLADGLQTFVISDAGTDAVLTSFAFLAGDALAEDIRAEMDLLRDELDMLKRAFRRHCAQTAAPE